VAGQWFSLVSSTNKTDRHDVTEILLKVALNIITGAQSFSLQLPTGLHKITIVVAQQKFLGSRN
jgi:hypothetical protein